MFFHHSSSHKIVICPSSSDDCSRVTLHTMKLGSFRTAHRSFTSVFDQLRITGEKVLESVGGIVVTFPHAIGVAVRDANFMWNRRYVLPVYDDPWWILALHADAEQLEWKDITLPKMDLMSTHNPVWEPDLKAHKALLPKLDHPTDFTVTVRFLRDVVHYPLVDLSQDRKYRHSRLDYPHRGYSFIEGGKMMECGIDTVESKQIPMWAAPYMQVIRFSECVSPSYTIIDRPPDGKAVSRNHQAIVASMFYVPTYAYMGAATRDFYHLNPVMSVCEVKTLAEARAALERGKPLLQGVVYLNRATRRWMHVTEGEEEEREDVCVLCVPPTIL